MREAESWIEEQSNRLLVDKAAVSANPKTS
jgi:hypothetical protein